MGLSPSSISSWIPPPRAVMRPFKRGWRGFIATKSRLMNTSARPSSRVTPSCIRYQMPSVSCSTASPFCTWNPASDRQRITSASDTASRYSITASGSGAKGLISYLSYR